MRMQILLNQFQISTGADVEDISRAWSRFSEYLIDHELASHVSALNDRISTSDFDSDEDNVHTHCAMIYFENAEQASRAWQTIEKKIEPLASLHREVMRLVESPSFTFWGNEE